LYSADDELNEKQKLEKQITETRKLLKKLEEAYYEKYLKNEGD
jgi:hypothetical protein